MYYLANMSSFEDYPAENVGTKFEKLFQASERANFNQDKMTQYDYELFREMDLKEQMDMRPYQMSAGF